MASCLQHMGLPIGTLSQMYHSFTCKDKLINNLEQWCANPPSSRIKKGKVGLLHEGCTQNHSECLCQWEQTASWAPGTPVSYTRGVRMQNHFARHTILQTLESHIHSIRLGESETALLSQIEFFTFTRHNHREPGLCKKPWFYLTFLSPSQSNTVHDIAPLTEEIGINVRGETRELQMLTAWKMPDKKLWFIHLSFLQSISLSSPVQKARWAHMCRFLSVCLSVCPSVFTQATLCTTTMVLLS